MILIIMFSFMIISACDGWGRSVPTPEIPSGFFKVDTLGSGRVFGYPSLSADGRYLAVATGKDELPQVGQLTDLYVVDLQTEELLFKSEYGLSASIDISPDGEHVITEAGDGKAVIIDVTSGGHRELNSGGYPVWSPDGQYIAGVFAYFDSSYSTLYLGINLVDLQSKTEKILYETQSEIGGYIAYINWSQDQQFLAFVMEKEDGLGLGELYLFDIDKREIQQLTSHWLVKTPRFSPDGDKVLFVGAPEPYEIGKDFDLYVMSINGDCHLITSPVPRLEGIALSQGSEKIAFDTYYGVLTADPEIVLGQEFWQLGEPCQ